ncbi:MAG: alanine--tRNA ligase [Propionibacteriaceae bacterium]|jgi:alanyl-tRNA synthetase|nr:alanine--tRNA ligase [Propionibacteriaceae bacterium]
MRTAEIRQRFLDFFAARGHTVVPSASLVYNDPTLLFVNAGMVQFKPYFTGAETPPYDRAVSVQKCVRTLDIEEVGKTTRHGTFFQMNGNFSFGDYFKEGAIKYAFDLITLPQSEGGFGFDADRIWVTILPSDDEAYQLWQSVAGMPKERIQARGLKDNYWNMGVPGPGGPCSEIYIDRGSQFGPDGGPNVDEDRFLEIWNLVFMQEELSAVRAKDDFDVLRPLPAKNIDTGMGLERVAYLLQNVDNLYEIDEVFPVLLKAAELSGKKYGHSYTADDVRMRVVADHIRSALMLMTDGVTPGNEARGYVLRRLLRRSMRAMRLLGVQEPVLPELLPVSKELMQASYSEVEEQWERVSQIAYAEEETFRRTLASGIRLFDLAASQTKASQGKVIPGDKAFEMHDTYGFPIDLTLEMASEAGLEVDQDAFRRLMQEQKDRAKADARAKKGGSVAVEAYRELRSEGETSFLGYTDLTADARIRGIIADGKLVPAAHPGEVVEVVLQQTPFYAEAGGQDADTGLITSASGVTLEVLDVQKPVQGLIVHKVKVADGEVGTGMEVLASVDQAARYGACQAHTATHIVNAALRHILGPSTHQQGSYNKPGYLRFDFNNPQGLSKDMQEELEGIANQAIRANHEVSAVEMPIAQAKALGAQAMFGEKYGEIVRMVELAGPWSRELCGGTHVVRTAEIGLLSLLGEASVGSGIRRVEAFVSADAFNQLAAERALVANLAETLKTQPEQLADRIAKLLADLKAAQKELAQVKAKQLLDTAPRLIAAAGQVGGYTLVSEYLAGVAGDDLRNLALQLRAQLGETAGVVALIGGDEKPVLIVATTAAARELGAKAGALVGVAAVELGGRGGGRDDIAQGGGADRSGVAAALDAISVALRG